MGNLQGLLHSEERSYGAHDHGRHVDDQLEFTEFQDVMIDGPAVPDRILDGSEIIIQNDDLACFLGCLRTAAHGKAHIRPLQGRGVINTVSGHAHYQIHLLTEPDHPGFIRRKRTRDYPDLRNDLLYFVIGHLIQLCGSQRPVGVVLQKTCISGNGNCRLQTVSGDHDNLNACISHLGNCISGLRSDIVADRHKADNDQIIMDCIFLQLLFRIAERQHTHGLFRQRINLLIEDGLVDGLYISVFIQIFPCLAKQTFRGAFIIGSAGAVDPGLAELVHGVKALRSCDLIILIALQCTERILSNEFHQRLVRGIAADYLVLCVKHGLCILSDRQIQQALYPRMPGKLRNRNHLPVCGKEFHDLQTSFGNGTGLITEQDIQRARGLDSFRFSYKHIVVQHPAGILHQHQRDHQRQSLRNCTDNDHDRKGYCIYNVLDDLLGAGGKVCRYSSCRHNKIGKIQNGNHGCAHIAEYRDLACQFGQLHLQRRIHIVLLHLVRHPAHHGLKSDFSYIQNSFAVEHNRSAEQGMCIHKGISGDLVRQFKAVFRRRLLTLFRLAV